MKTFDVEMSKRTFEGDLFHDALTLRDYTISVVSMSEFGVEPEECTTLYLNEKEARELVEKLSEVLE